MFTKQNFNPRPPRGGRPAQVQQYANDAYKFQSTPPARGATDGGSWQLHQARISIHAPREGGDGLVAQLAIRIGISIHAPREGGDVSVPATVSVPPLFQSTPPARGATAKMHSFTRGSLTNK